MDRNWTEILCHNISWLRKFHRLSRAAMAALLHISVHWLDEIEGGHIPLNLGVEVLFYIAQYFGVPLNDQLERRLGE